MAGLLNKYLGLRLMQGTDENIPDFTSLFIFLVSQKEIVESVFAVVYLPLSMTQMIIIIASTSHCCWAGGSDREDNTG